MTPSNIIPQANGERTHSTMIAWRVREFGPPEVMKFERVPHPSLALARSWSKLMPLGSDHGMPGSGPERAHCRNRSRSRWARIFPVKSSRWGPGFPNYVWEIRFMVLRIRSLSGSTPSTL